MDNKITPENYEGYCELYKSKFMGNDEVKSDIKYILKLAIFTGILFVGSVFLGAPAAIVYLLAVNFAVVPTITFLRRISKKTKSLREDISNRYSNINVNLNFDELENMLIDAKILKCGVVNGQYCKELDIEGYKNYIKCEKLKQEFIDEYKKAPLEFDYSIPFQEFEKTKVKVKTIGKRGM